jgi:YfiH family protein
LSDEWFRADWPAPPGIIAGTTLKGSEFALPAKPRFLNQVHGTRAVRMGSPDFDDGAPDADAVIADRSGDICVVRTADCLPILLSSLDGQEIAAIHAGWRGLAAGIVEATLDEMNTPAADLIAWFGPAISQAAFEVGSEVRESFGEWGQIEALFRVNERGRLQADLFGLARARLSRNGVLSAYGGGLCTVSDPQRFYSYRRDGDTGRMLSFIYRS